MNHHRTYSPTDQAEHLRKRRLPISALHDLVPLHWEEPLLVRIDPEWGFHDIAEKRVGISLELLDEGVKRIGVPKVWGYCTASLVVLCSHADEDLIVLNPGDTIAMQFKNMPRKRVRSLLWALTEMGAVR